MVNNQLGVDGLKYFDKNFDVAAGAVMSPSLSIDPECKVRMMKYLAMGALHTVGTDNCTFSEAQKKRGEKDFTKIPNGCNGLEDRMSIVWTKGVKAGYLSPMDFVRVTSS
jgi:dihydropyrimidinase